jgi:hypothetical protein
MDFHVERNTLIALNLLVDQLTTFICGVLSIDSSMSFDTFVHMISNANNLRHLYIREYDTLFNLKNVESVYSNGFLITAEFCHVDNTCDEFMQKNELMQKMTQRNKNNLQRCRSTCETLLALKRFRLSGVAQMLGRDMLIFLSRCLLKTWGDVDSWTTY